VAEELLRNEGFSDVQYVPKARADADRALGAGEVDINIAGFAGNFVVAIDAGAPILLLAGIHVGCFELFATEGIRTLRDLRGKTVGVTEAGSGRHLFLASAMAAVGLDLRKDVRLVHRPPAESVQLFAEGRMDAYQAFSEEVYELRDRRLGRVILDSTHERPWSQYFCCMVGANRDFVRRHPVAAKRALRAILKATDMCGLEPERAARILLDGGHIKGDRGYETMVRLLKELPYRRWRESNPEDTVRFYALRLHEAGLIKSSPQRIISQGTDWRFVNELKKELKA
jgi:NitT/TauT family transport system substrate-binding protein